MDISEVSMAVEKKRQTEDLVADMLMKRSVNCGLSGITDVGHSGGDVRCRRSSARELFEGCVISGAKARMKSRCETFLDRYRCTWKRMRTSYSCVTLGRSVCVAKREGM